MKYSLDIIVAYRYTVYWLCGVTSQPSTALANGFAENFTSKVIQLFKKLKLNHHLFAYRYMKINLILLALRE